MTPSMLDIDHGDGYGIDEKAVIPDTKADAPSGGKIVPKSRYKSNEQGNRNHAAAKEPDCQQHFSSDSRGSKRREEPSRYKPAQQ